MPTFFDPAAQRDLYARLQALTPASPRQWGTLEPAGMLAHCAAALRMPLGDLVVPAGPIRYIGWLFKGRIARPDPVQRNLPTAPALVVADPGAFETERESLRAAMEKLAAGPETIRSPVHPFFGKLTKEQWGQLVHKHLDHHFRQFGG